MDFRFRVGRWCFQIVSFVEPPEPEDPPRFAGESEVERATPQAVGFAIDPDEYAAYLEAR